MGSESGDGLAWEARVGLSKLFTSGPVALCLFDPGLRLTHANAALAELVGSEREELVGGSLRDYVHPADLDVALPTVGRLFTGERPDVRLDVRWIGQSSEPVWVRMVASLVHDSLELPLYGIGIVESIADLKQQEAELRSAADLDSLTGLLIRRRFDTELAQHLARCTRYGATGALILFDVDGLKWVNDRLGHAAGDAVLRAVAETLRNRLRASDVVSRYGGDEFMVLLPEAGSGEALRLAEELAALLRDLDVPDAHLGLGASVGVAVIDDFAVCPEALIGIADVAMYEAKRSGDHGVRLLLASERSAISRSI